MGWTDYSSSTIGNYITFTISLSNITNGINGLNYSYGVQMQPATPILGRQPV
jgi:hypothetical protein